MAVALNRPVAEFFVDGDALTSDGETASLPRHFTLTRATSGATKYVSGQVTYRMLSDRGPSLVLEPMLVNIAPGGRSEEAYAHAGEEFVHLRSSVPHSMYNDTDQVTTVVSVVTPRLF
ncbi:cupin domain-containing protein [Streptomyces sp. DSM 41524]|uniref:Cupin domain-containing protein n=1 Tax=Streptomyces asiaticus subsp. ignotus TaxID=3098222 RepID=A0ABU7QB68_9ACTN|nr:cupin domain-containing protein [Streptomyces sp. DSM 41524]